MAIVLRRTEVHTDPTALTGETKDLRLETADRDT